MWIYISIISSYQRWNYENIWLCFARIFRLNFRQSCYVLTAKLLRLKLQELITPTQPYSLVNYVVMALFTPFPTSSAKQAHPVATVITVCLVSDGSPKHKRGRRKVATVRGINCLCITGICCTKVDKRSNRNNSLAPGPRLNIKTVLSAYGVFHVKDKTAVRTSYL